MFRLEDHGRFSPRSDAECATDAEALAPGRVCAAAATWRTA
jgi:hypothetical protein